MGSRVALGNRKTRNAETSLRLSTLFEQGCVYTLAFHSALAERRGSPLRLELERALLNSINSYRFSNPRHLYGLLDTPLPDTAARLVIYICLEQRDASPIISFIRKNGISADLRNYSIEYAQSALDKLSGEPDMKELLRIHSLKSLPEKLKSYMEGAIDTAIYVCKVTDNEKMIAELCASRNAPESALHSAIDLCRDKKWTSPLDALIARRKNNGKKDDVFNNALRARKSIGEISKKSLEVLITHGLHRIRGLPRPDTQRLGGGSVSRAGQAGGSRRVAAQCA